MERWLTLRTLVVLALGATLGFPALALLGFEVESVHVTTYVAVLAALAALLVRRSARRFLARFTRGRKGR